ncbi:hypothetical protein L6452_25344 [Arctium lappa]|uniref:Uncharacterized protein n=1 Tax=Arctium lappa TaxID=4217 RepID=A0ACB9ABK4_ARCLA|nr:hypothetical protein L6452_25344 [Arctium lappa]
MADSLHSSVPLDLCLGGVSSKDFLSSLPPSSSSVVDFFPYDPFHTFIETYPITLHSSLPIVYCLEPWLCSHKYEYCVGVEEEDVRIMSYGARASLNQMPELFPDLKVADHKGSPLKEGVKTFRGD